MLTWAFLWYCHSANMRPMFFHVLTMGVLDVWIVSLIAGVWTNV